MFIIRAPFSPHSPPRHRPLVRLDSRRLEDDYVLMLFLVIHSFSPAWRLHPGIQQRQGQVWACRARTRRRLPKYFLVQDAQFFVQSRVGIKTQDYLNLDIERTKQYFATWSQYSKRPYIYGDLGLVRCTAAIECAQAAVDTSLVGGPRSTSSAEDIWQMRVDYIDLSYLECNWPSDVNFSGIIPLESIGLVVPACKDLADVMVLNNYCCIATIPQRNEMLLVGTNGDARRACYA